MEERIRQAHKEYAAAGEENRQREGFRAVEFLLGVVDGTRAGADLLRAEHAELEWLYESRLAELENQLGVNIRLRAEGR